MEMSTIGKLAPRDAEEEGGTSAWCGDNARLSAAGQLQDEMAGGVRFAPWQLTRVQGDPADGAARAEHLAFLQNFLATHDFRGPTGRLQRLAVAKRLSRVGGGSSCSPKVTTPTADDLATEAWGQPTEQPVASIALAPELEPTVLSEPKLAYASSGSGPADPEDPPPARVPTVAIAGHATTEPPAIPTTGAGAERALPRLTAGKRYVCKRRAVIRSHFEINSNKVGTLERDAVIDALEERSNEQGTVRVQFGQGWVSKTTAAGLVVLAEEDSDGGMGADVAEVAISAPVVAAAPSTHTQRSLDTGAVCARSAGMVGEHGSSDRYCKKCKVVFSTETCPGGHANFMYTKKLPT